MFYGPCMSKTVCVHFVCQKVINKEMYGIQSTNDQKSVFYSH